MKEYGDKWYFPQLTTLVALILLLPFGAFFMFINLHSDIIILFIIASVILAILEFTCIFLLITFRNRPLKIIEENNIIYIHFLSPFKKERIIMKDDIEKIFFSQMFIKSDRYYYIIIYEKDLIEMFPFVTRRMFINIFKRNAEHIRRDKIENKLFYSRILK